MGAAGLLMVLWLWINSVEWVHHAMVKRADQSAAAGISNGGGRVVLGFTLTEPRISGATKWDFTSGTCALDETDPTGPWFSSPFVTFGTPRDSGGWVLHLRLPHWLITAVYLPLWAVAIAWCYRAGKRKRRRVVRAG